MDNRQKLIAETEKQMQYSEFPCASCTGKGLNYLHGGQEVKMCSACGGEGVIRFKKKNLVVEDIGPILEENSLKDPVPGVMIVIEEDDMDRMMQFFHYGHLPEELQVISKPFHELALTLVENLPSNPERTVALRKLLEAKDCAVRAKLYKEPEEER